MPEHFEKDNAGRIWSECTLREYLNGSFLDGTFGLNMQKKILDTNIKVENNSTYGWQTLPRPGKRKW